MANGERNQQLRQNPIRINKIDIKGDKLKEIPNYAPYVITEDGEIYNPTRKNNGPLSTWIDNVGYKMVVLHQNNHRKYLRVHRLVALTYLPNECPEIYTQVNHIDGNKLNNHVSNLEWITNAENTKHGYEMKAYPKHRSQEVYAIPKNDPSKRIHFKSIRNMCETLHVNRKTVSRILDGSKKTNNYDYDFAIA